MHIIFLALLLSFITLAQHSAQPEKESSADLRSTMVMFSIVDEMSDKIYWLERTVGEDYFLRMKSGKNKETLLKISGRDARAMDLDFSSRFLKAQYEIPSKDGDCKVTLRLMLKGDEQEICQKDDGKAQEFAAFIKGLKKRF